MNRSKSPRALTALAVLALAGAGAVPRPVHATPALADKHACIGCHAVDRKLVGPAYADVAKKYAGQPGARAAIARSIRAGGAGRWGPVPMPPQPTLPDADLDALAAWILGGAK